jgi:hypothetical protein
MRRGARATWLWLALLVVGVVVGRFGLLYGSEFVYDEEEYKTGSIAALILDDPQLPLLEYQPGDYEGGTLLFGLLTIPFFLLLGKKYLALKLLAVTTSVVMAVAAAVYAWRHGGKAAGWATGALFVLPAPYVLQVGLLPWGNYAENATLTLVALVIASRLLDGKRHAAWAYALFGALLGLGVWMHYGFLVTVVLIALWWLLIRPRAADAKRVVLAGAGALVGFSPWLVYNVSHSWWGLRRFADARVDHAEAGGWLTGSVGRLFGLCSRDFAAGLHFRWDSVTWSQWISYLYAVTCLALLVALVYRHRQRALETLRAFWPRAKRVAPDDALWRLMPVGYVALYTLVYSVTEYGLFQPGWGSLDPETHCHIFALYPMMLLICGLGFGALWTTRARTVGAAALAVLLALGGVGYASLLTPDRPQAQRLARDAYDPGVIYMEIGSKWGADPTQLKQIQDRLSGRPLRSFVYGAGMRFSLDDPSLPTATAKCAAQPSPLLPYCWFGIGTGLYQGSALPLAAVDEVVRSAPQDIRPWLIAGGCVGNIWSDRAGHWTCEAARESDVAALAPANEVETARSFVAGQLGMLQFRPAKN